MDDVEDVQYKLVDSEREDVECRIRGMENAISFSGQLMERGESLLMDTALVVLEERLEGLAAARTQISWTV